MCVFDTFVMLCTHITYGLKEPCHNKRDHGQCFGPPMTRSDAIYPQDDACPPCQDWFNRLAPAHQPAQFARWQAEQLASMERRAEAKRAEEERQAKEKKKVDEMIKKGPRDGGRGGKRGGGGGGSSSSAGMWSHRESKKPYGRGY